MNEQRKIKTGCERSQCPITNTLDVIGDKWTLLIVRDMMILGKSQYSDFITSHEGISTNILADRLKKLEEFNVITKRAYQTNPVRHEYHLTEIGLSLRPILTELAKWGGQHVEGAYNPTDEEIEDIMNGSMKDAAS